eukprot:Sdes_comp18358_c0_seq1m8127
MNFKTKASGGNDGNLFLWDIRSSGRYLHSFQQNNTKNSISLAHHFRGKKSPFVLSAARKSTLKYSKSDPSNGLCEAHPRGVNGIQFTPDGLFLLSTGRDSRLRMWDVMKGTDSLVHFAGVKNTRKMNVQFSLAVDSTPDLVFHPCLNSVGRFLFPHTFLMMIFIYNIFFALIFISDPIKDVTWFKLENYWGN